MARRQTLQDVIAELAGRGRQEALLAFAQGQCIRQSSGELADEVARFAAGLAMGGVRQGEHVVLLATNQPAWVSAALAVLAAGAVVVPLDPQIDDRALGAVLADCRPRAVITTSEYMRRIERLDPDGDARVVLLDVAHQHPQSWRRLQGEAGTSLPRAGPEDVAVLFYTSGTTGEPKGVPLRHRQLVFQLEAVGATGIVAPGDRILLPLPLYHVYPFAIGMLVPLALGLPIILPESPARAHLARALTEGKPTVIVGVPRLYRALVSGIEQQFAERGPVGRRLYRALLALSGQLRRRTGRRAGRTLLAPVHRRFGPQLRLLTSGGSALDQDVAEALYAIGWDVGIGYGLTETAPLLTINPPNSGRLGSAGRALPGVELRLDAPGLPTSGSVQLVPGAQGEVLARGPGVFTGYRNLPEQTAAAFTPDGWFRTGDLGSFDADGYLTIHGRASAMLVLESGKNIQPEPVEEVFGAHPAVQEVGVLVEGGRLVSLFVLDPETLNRFNGDADRVVRAVLVAQGVQLPSYAQLIDYAVVPGPLPRTNLGKLRRHLLPELFRAAKAGRAVSTTVMARPAAIEELSLADQALLEQPAARAVWDWLCRSYGDRRLTPDTSPQAELGVDSLEWLNLSLEIQERTGVELSEAMIRRVVTVRDLLREVAGAAEAATPTDLFANPEGHLTAAQRRWLEPIPHTLNLAGAPLYLLNRFLARGLFQLEVEGLERLPLDRPFVLTPNHQSYLDAFVLGAALPYGLLQRTYWAGSADIAFANPLARTFSRIAQAVPVGGRNTGMGRDSLAFGAAILRRRRNLVWFPEGWVSPTGELFPFRHGIGLLLHNVPATVVPVWIDGTHQALPLGKLLPRRSPVRVVFGTPVESVELTATGLGATPAERIAEALHERVAALAHGRGRIHEMMNT